MKKKAIYHLIPLLLAATLAACNNPQGKIPSLRETFSKKDKNPFGAYVLHNQLEQLFYHNSILDREADFESTWRNITDTASVYICLSKNLFLSNYDKESMLAYVANGNSLFISSQYIDTALLDTLGCSIARKPHPGTMPLMKYTSVGLDTVLFEHSSAFTYYYYPLSNHFSKFDSSFTQVLGRNESGESNFIVVFYGKGRFYLHTEPRALSNYFLLQKNNYRYLQFIFSFMPGFPEHVYWDDHYNKKNTPGASKSNGSGLSVLLQFPAMAWAFWLLLLLLLLYIVFAGKRRQRIIPGIVPNINSTVAFTETVGRLYFQKKHNRNMADKMITYFFENIRNQYFLNTNHINDEFITMLGRKTNISKDEMTRLLNTIQAIQQSGEISDQQLLSLNQQIEEFYKNKI